MSGSSSTGTDLWHLHVSFTDPAIAALLPPSADHLWILRLNEAGYLNTAGRLTGLTLTWHAPGGDQNFIGGPLPVATLERGEVDASIPWGVASVAPESADRGIAFGPSPTSAGASVRFIDGRGLARELRVYDLAGREVGHAAFTGAGGSRSALWSARDPRGFALASGVYLARVDTGRAVRVVVLGQ